MKGLIKEMGLEGANYRDDLPIPKIKSNEVLVRVRACAICGTDIHIYNWTQYAKERVKLPMVFGHEFAGEIVEIGANVNGYAIGDRVAGETHIPCGECEQCRTGNMHICENMRIIGVQETGAFAEYVPVHHACLWKLDDSIDYESGALLEPMGVGAHGVLSGEIGGKSIAILGCGPIGLCAVGVASACGANGIFAMDMTEPKLDWARKMGATVLINSQNEDAVGIVRQATQGKGVDVVVDYTGNQQAISLGFDMLKKGGRYTMVGLANGDIAINVNESIIYKEARINGVTGRQMYKTWYDCEKLIKAGKFDLKQVIGGVFALSDYKKAFDALKAGMPGKALLIP